MRYKSLQPAGIDDKPNSGLKFNALYNTCCMSDEITMNGKEIKDKIKLLINNNF